MMLPIHSLTMIFLHSQRHFEIGFLCFFYRKLNYWTCYLFVFRIARNDFVSHLNSSLPCWILKRLGKHYSTLSLLLPSYQEVKLFSLDFTLKSGIKSILIILTFAFIFASNYYYFKRLKQYRNYKFVSSLFIGILGN